MLGLAQQPLPPPSCPLLGPRNPLEWTREEQPTHRLHCHTGKNRSPCTTPALVLRSRTHGEKTQPTRHQRAEMRAGMPTQRRIVIRSNQRVPKGRFLGLDRHRPARHLRRDPPVPGLWRFARITPGCLPSAPTFCRILSTAGAAAVALAFGLVFNDTRTPRVRLRRCERGEIAPCRGSCRAKMIRTF